MRNTVVTCQLNILKIKQTKKTTSDNNLEHLYNGRQKSQKELKGRFKDLKHKGRVPYEEVCVCVCVCVCVRGVCGVSLGSLPHKSMKY